MDRLEEWALGPTHMRAASQRPVGMKQITHMRAASQRPVGMKHIEIRGGQLRLQHMRATQRRPVLSKTELGVVVLVALEPDGAGFQRGRAKLQLSPASMAPRTTSPGGVRRTPAIAGMMPGPTSCPCTPRF